MVHGHIEERNLLGASQFGFHARHGTTIKCVMLADHVTLGFNGSMSTAAVFLGVGGGAFDMAWHLGLLCGLLEPQFSAGLIGLIVPFLAGRGFQI
jgi:hypothetical protein